MTWLIYAIGFLAQGFFSARILVQWIMSERARKVLSPSLFWIFSIAGSYLLCLYGVLRQDFAIVLGQFISYYVYLWNLKAKGIWANTRLWLRTLLIATPLIALIAAAFHAEAFIDSFFHNKDVPYAAFAEAAESEGFVAEHRDEYRDVIAAMLANPEAARWFDPANHIDTEIPYHAPWEEGDKGDPEHLGKVRRMDRLVELSDGSIEVVDYKFTKIQDIDNINQVRGYMASMATVFPGRTIRGYLWYHDLGLIIPVSAS